MTEQQAPADLRRWLTEAADADEVQRVDGAHWDLEIGALSQMNYRRSHPKALLFDEIPATHRVCGCSAVR